MIMPNNRMDISTEVDSVNAWVNRLNDGFYTTRLHAYITHELSKNLNKEEIEVAKLYQGNDNHESYSATKISDKVYVVENHRYKKGKTVNSYYFAYYGQKHIIKEAYETYEIAAIAGLLFSSMGKNAMSESILNIIIESMKKEG